MRPAGKEPALIAVRVLSRLLERLAETGFGTRTGVEVCIPLWPALAFAVLPVSLVCASPLGRTWRNWLKARIAVAMRSTALAPATTCSPLVKAARQRRAAPRQTGQAATDEECWTNAPGERRGRGLPLPHHVIGRRPGRANHSATRGDSALRESRWRVRGVSMIAAEQCQRCLDQCDQWRNRDPLLGGMLIHRACRDGEDTGVRP